MSDKITVDIQLRLVAKSAKTCDGCVFNGMPISYCFEYPCGYVKRPDKRNIIWIIDDCQKNRGRK